MSEIPEQLRTVVEKRFEKELVSDVRLVLFTQEMECQFCKHARELVEEVAGWSEKITLEVYDFEKDKERAKDLGIDKIPALAILGAKDYGIRYFGIPTGYEFQVFIEAILLVSSGDSQLPQGALAELDKVIQPALIQVLVIPTCSACPIAAAMGLQFAIYSDNITLHIVEIAEFPHIANKYNVIGTPKIVINETVEHEGVPPPAQYIQLIQKAVQGSPTGISSTI